MSHNQMKRSAYVGYVEKMSSMDKDFRFMAINDLMSELKRDTVVPSDVENSVVKGVLHLLSDKNGEIRTLSVNCLKLLLLKVSDKQKENVVERLCEDILSQDDSLREVSFMGIKIALMKLPKTSTCISILLRLNSHLIGTINSQKDSTVQFEALDLMTELMKGYGSSLVANHQESINGLLRSLKSTRRPNRKKANQAIAAACPCLSNELFKEVLNANVIVELESNGPQLLTFVNLLTLIIKSSGSRVSQSVNTFGALINQRLSDCIRSESDGSEELLESLLTCFASILETCSYENEALFEPAVDFGLQMLSFDPNYEDDNDDDENYDEDEDGDDADDDAYSDNDVSEDDDMSYTVRHASCNLLHSVVVVNSKGKNKLTEDQVRRIMMAIVNRLSKEREASVKEYLFSTLSYVIQLCGLAKFKESILEENKEFLVNSLEIQLKGKSETALQGCYLVCTMLSQTLPSAFNDKMSDIGPQMSKALSNKSFGAALKSSIFNFVVTTIETHPSYECQKLCEYLVANLCDIACSNYSKIASESLSVISAFLSYIRPSQKMDIEDSFNLSTYIPSLYNVIVQCMEKTHADVEYREKSISALCHLISFAGDLLDESQFSNSMDLVLKHMDTELYRMATVHGISTIASSTLKFDINAFLPVLLHNLSENMKKNNKLLRLESVKCLHSLFLRFHNESSLQEPNIREIILATDDVVDIADLQITPIVLRLWQSILKFKPECASIVSLDKVFPMLLSPLLQGSVFTSVIDLMMAISNCESSFSMSTGDIFNRLIEPIYNYNPSTLKSELIDRREHFATAKCVAVICKDDPIDTANRFIVDLEDFIIGNKLMKKKFLAKSLLALSCLGEIGCSADLSSTRAADCFYSCFGCDSEELKFTAAVSLGLFSCGNLNIYLPKIIEDARTQSKYQSLLLISLKKIVSYLINNKKQEIIERYTEKIWTLFFQDCALSEEGTRNVVAECVGKLCLANNDNDTYAKHLEELLNSNDNFIRATAVGALKFCVSYRGPENNHHHSSNNHNSDFHSSISTSATSPAATGSTSNTMEIDVSTWETTRDLNTNASIDTFIKTQVKKAMYMIDDDNLSVRRVALITMNSVAQNKSSYLIEELDSLLPMLLKQTDVDPSLVSQLPMGPFFYRKDDGLDLRKAAFETMYTMLEWCVPYIEKEMNTFMTQIIKGLSDEYDIKMITHLLLIRLCSVAPEALFHHMNEIIAAMISTFKKSLASHSTQQDIEKKTELMRSGIRAILALKKMPNSDRKPKLAEILKGIQDNKTLKEIYSQVLTEEEGGNQ